MGGGMGGVVVYCSPLTAVVRVRVPARAWIICELSLFDVLFSPLPRGFFSGSSGFPPSVKINMRGVLYAKTVNVGIVCMKNRAPFKLATLNWTTLYKYKT